MSGAAHVAAALVALRAVPSLTVYDGVVPDRPSFPYVVAFASTGRGRVERLEGSADRIDVDVHVTCVGLTRESAAWAGERARDVLLAHLEVPGRRTWRGVHLDSQPIRRDDDVTDQVVLYGTDLYRLSSNPA